MLKKGIVWNLGRGDKIKLWTDVWLLDETALIEKTINLVDVSLINRLVSDFACNSN